MFITNKKINVLLKMALVLIAFWVIVNNTLLKTFLILIVLFIAWIEHRRVSVKKINLIIKDLPKAFDNYKIAFASDIHSDRFNHYYFAHKTLSLLKQETFDVCLLGGDFIGQPKYAKQTIEILAQLKPAYMVLGNHDHVIHRQWWKNVALNNQITLLEDEHTKLFKGDAFINLYGLADLSLHTNPHFNFRHDQVNIVLSHQPDSILTLAHQNVDLYLCGHTHGGQITLFNQYAPYLPTKMKDTFKKGIVIFQDTLMYITTGVGTTFLPFRLFARAEVVIFTLTAE